MNAHVGFQIGKFGTRLAALIAIVIFLCIRVDLANFGQLRKFLIYDLCIQRLLKALVNWYN